MEQTSFVSLAGRLFYEAFNRSQITTAFHNEDVLPLKAVFCFVEALDFFGERDWYDEGELILVIMFGFSRLIDVVSERAPRDFRPCR